MFYTEMVELSLSESYCIRKKQEEYYKSIYAPLYLDKIELGCHSLDHQQVHLILLLMHYFLITNLKKIS